ncbi:hypothetical protein Egran_06505 [Elaphomyces granulatus]|uniref:Uncharacterized protein n=1 Tax=Elaphomyces granulatus TaxID=519963 RepID=A0A232LPI4_9EURO|nr:hypothetical protein Egran_06505 [Elaphomyces granulatus]
MSAVQEVDVTESDPEVSFGFDPRVILTLARAFRSLFVTVGVGTSFSVFLHLYKEELLGDSSETAIAWILRIHLFLLFFSPILTDLAVERYGTRVS